MKLTEEQENFLNDVVQMGGWALNTETGLVDVEGHIIIQNYYIKDGLLPVKFGEVLGDFNCSRNGLTSLEGSPHTVGRGYYCHANQLISLKGAPHKVGVDFHCDYNQLTSLEGAPSYVGGHLYCKGNPIVSLEGFPSYVGYHSYLDLPDKQSEHYDKVMCQLITLINSGVIKNKEEYQSHIDAWLNKQMLHELNSSI